MTASQQGQDGTEFNPDPAMELSSILTLLMMGKGNARNMWNFLTNKIWEIRASGCFY
jgi:hypothetical protein